MDITIVASQFYNHSEYFLGYSKATIRRYKYVIDLYCRIAAIQSMAEISEENVRQLFFVGRTERSWKVNTYICFHKTLKVFFRWCIAQRYLSTNPIDAIEIPRHEKRLPPKLTKQEALRLLDISYNYPYGHRFLRTRNHAIFSMFIFAGLRKGELLHLKFTDVDIENLSIFVRQGKGNKDRIIPMSFTLAQSLKRYVEERKRLFKTCPEFYVSFNRNMGFTENGLKHLVELIRKAAKNTFTVHKLRHTFATLMLEGGCDIYSLSKMMGHSDIKTTTIYLAASAEHLRGQMMKHPLNNIVK